MRFRLASLDIHFVVALDMELGAVDTVLDKAGTVLGMVDMELGTEDTALEPVDMELDRAVDSHC